jgi:error-prone DNA polymerase
MQYLELHAHSNFSLLDGACFPEQLVEAAARRGMAAIALTDHNALYGVPRFYKAAQQAGIKPVIGAEMTLHGRFHLTLLAQNAAGYANLCRLVTRSQLAGSKGSPRLDFQDLDGFTGGLICLSGCKHGEIATLLLQGKPDEAEKAARTCMSVFAPRHFYIELQHHLDPEDAKLCRSLADLAAKLGVPVVATNNVHYTDRADFRLHDVLTCIGNRVGLDDSAPLRRPNSEYYLKGGDEMARLPGISRAALDATCAVADTCAFRLDFSSYCFPDFPLPPGETAAGCLRNLCDERARRTYGNVPSDVRARLDEELPLIESKGLCGYFLIVRDIMEFARTKGILAQGRGSAASSLVAYLLGITPVDPLKHSLFVGRFLNESAVPDIDIDIDTQRREEVIAYVYEKYGEEHAAMVCTYVTFRARNAIREVGKVFGFPPPVIDRMAKCVSAYSPAHAIRELADIAEFKPYLDSAAWEHFCRITSRIADFPRHLSIHVGGMIVSSKPVCEMVPLERARAAGRVVCQWDKDGVDDAGLIKVDLLGLRMLSLIDEAVRTVKQTQGVAIDLGNLPEDDARVYDMIGRADTVGIFQVESRAQMQSLPRVKPRSLEDLGVQVAIIRPGPLQGDMVHPYMRRRNREEPVAHLHPALEPILRETLGVILFQEQILQVAMAIAGFSAGDANRLRKAMGRKHARIEMEKWRTAFLEGAAARHIDGARATKIFELISGFAEFGFCKSHAMSFALLCYRSAFLKLYYPAEFYCALLNNQPMGFYIPEVVIGDARRHGVTILPVDVNESRWDCRAGDMAVRLGFRYVRSMGEEGAEWIVAERKKGAFRSFKDFCLRIRVDKDALKNLIVVGAFDGLERSRRQLLWLLRTIDTQCAQPINLDTSEKVRLDEMNRREELFAAYSVQGFSASAHLLKPYRQRLTQTGAVTSSRLQSLASGARVKLAGYNVCLQVPPTAKGFAFITLEDEEGLMNIVLRPDIYRAYRKTVRLAPLLLVEGTLEKKGELINVIAATISSLSGSA